MKIATLYLYPSFFVLMRNRGWRLGLHRGIRSDASLHVGGNFSIAQYSVLDDGLYMNCARRQND
jgi:hypothetical protein